MKEPFKFPAMTVRLARTTGLHGPDARLLPGQVANGFTTRLIVAASCRPDTRQADARAKRPMRWITGRDVHGPASSACPGIGYLVWWKGPGVDGRDDTRLKRHGVAL